MFQYLVAYHFPASKGLGSGNVVVTRHRQVETEGDVRQIEEKIRQVTGFSSCSIANIQRLPI